MANEEYISALISFCGIDWNTAADIAVIDDRETRIAVYMALYEANLPEGG